MYPASKTHAPYRHLRPVWIYHIFLAAALLVVVWQTTTTTLQPLLSNGKTRGS
jgi:hypothetical protein